VTRLGSTLRSPRITAIHACSGSVVEVWLDDRPWRRLPTEVVLRAGLDVGIEIDRARARTIGRERRMHEALAVATRALRGRDHSAASLVERLDRRAIRRQTAAEAVAILSRVGLVDDGRTAVLRAVDLARRGYGNAWIEADLEQRGYTRETIDSAVAGLEREPDRIDRVVARDGARARTLALLARRGFSEEALEPLVAGLAESEIA
jgi:SOS response regulatory protein OraA/RecX